MAKGDHSFRKKPNGSTVGGYVRARVQIGFDKETRQTIANLAKAGKRSFASEVRELVSIGLKVKAIARPHLTIESLGG